MCLCLLLQRSGYQDSVLPHSGQARLHPIRAPSPFLRKQAHQLFLYDNLRVKALTQGYLDIFVEVADT
jgi:hypothetical protein